ncbi:YjzD family protein [Bacillus sp. 1P06AnD]|uniref:YjzD family protein n=1 Tax=Bacillus sp. 1P06AnD TaxID=3132208 RepID=UPI0039A0F468
MRYIATFFWVVLLLQMITYVVSSMIGASYDYMIGLYLSVPVTIIVSILPLVIGDEPAESVQH